MSAKLIFDIETIPDVAGVRTLNDLPAELADDEVAEFAFQQARAARGNDFLAHHLQRVVTISCLFCNGNQLKVFSLSEPESNEGELIQRFFDGVEKYSPQLVSWNGGGFDLPVLHYRGLIHGVAAPRYWDQGDGDYHDSRDFKWNSYLGRYHARHLDLMDLLAMYQPRANAPLDELAKLIGFPGKLGMDGSAVWQAYREGRVSEIRDYCETDVANTYLVFLRFELMRGHLDKGSYQAAIEQLRETLAGYPGEHWRRFLSAWPVAE